MRKEYYNYVVKLPVLLHELFRGKVADYHFSDMTVVMNHLVKSYIRMTDGGRVSTATRRILLCMDRIPDMSFFFRRQEKAVLFFEMDPAVADSLQRAIVSGGWGNRQRLAVKNDSCHFDSLSNSISISMQCFAFSRSSMVSKSGTICSLSSQPVQRASSNTLKTSDP